MMLPRAALAFKPLGHDVIEASAYKRLLAEPVVPGVGVSGKEVLASLIRRGVLIRPSCFPGDDSGHTSCTRGVNDLPGDWLPEVRSGREDLWLARQFDGAEQCFHFMAPTSDVYESAHVTASGVPDRMVDLAPGRCMRFVNGMVDSILGSDHHADDAYVLLHSVVDSYSGAHALRDQANGWKLEYLKPWRLIGAIDYCAHPSGWKFWSLTYHHDVSDAADDAWKIDSPACPAPAEDGVYSVPESCLTDRAKEAVAVAHDTLVALFVMTNAGSKTHHAAAWTSVLMRLAGGGPGDPPAELERHAPYPSESVWTPGLTAAAALGTYTTVRRTEALARLDWVLQGFPLFAPLVPSLRVDAGGAHGADAGWVVRSPIMGFTLPVGHALSIEMPSLQLQVREGPKLDVVTNLVGLQLFPVDGYFVGVAAGQYSFATGVTDLAPSVMLGYAAGSETTAVHAHLGHRGPRKQPPASRVMAVVNPTTDDWLLPATYSPVSERVRYWYLYATEIGFSPAGGQAGLLGQEVVWRFAPWGAAGVHALLGGMEVSGSAYFSGRGFPVLRLSPVPGGFVAFESQPIGVVAATTGNRGFVAGMATPLSLVFDLGDLQIVLDGPTGTWADMVHGVEGRGSGLTDGTLVGLRFGADEHW
ncbi:MAG TPA: hypothetical protein VF765_23650 [Polyangiaceae bacterium]